MEKEIVILRNILMSAALIEISVGLLHFLMPYYLYDVASFHLLTENEKSFVTLLTLAIGILLVAFGSVTVLFSKNITQLLDVLFIYLLIKVALWLARVSLELLYPIELKLFYIEPFTLVVLPGVIFEFVLFIYSLYLVSKLLKRKRLQ